MIKLALPLEGIRTGFLGDLPVGSDYMAGVKARARMLARACRMTDGKDGCLKKHPVDVAHLVDGEDEH